jgi:2-methylcitrate dehydratase PrpD
VSTTTTTPPRAETAPATSPPPAHTIAERLGRFAAELRYEHLPSEVVERAKLLILDGVGVALASGTFDFAHRALAAASDLAGAQRGPATVLGQRLRLPLRDAAHVNGLLIHGLDYDDTHPAGIVHATASAFPTALAVAEADRLPGRELLTGYVLGLEVAARLGAAARGGFHQTGFHPTGLVGAFAAAVAASRLRQRPAAAIAAAQGFVGSLAAGSLEFLATGAWTKRSHPGWAAVCGLTAAAYAAHGYESPPAIYEGRFGLYASHLGADHGADLAACTAALGERWETLEVAVKPYPACHFTHAFADAALALREGHGLRPDDIARVTCRIAQGEVGTVCEPADAKRRPRSAYDAAFSLPYIVAAALVRGRFGLEELADEALTDPTVLAVADRTGWEADPGSGFPQVYSGEVVVVTTDGRTLRHREQVNRGAAQRALTAGDILSKFSANAALALAPLRAERVAEVILALDAADDVRALAPTLGA